MQKSRVFLFSVLLVLIVCAPAMAADRVTMYTTWDQFFFYAAFEVQDPDVVSTNTTHMSNPWEDDDVEVFFETNNQRAENRSIFSYQMAVSAGGGSSFLVGKDGVATPRKIFTFKYGRRVIGTMNNSTDKDIGYVVELAIPWREMGGYPIPGQVMGFNVICRMRGETNGIVSLSPDVKTETDVQVPAKWTQMKFVDKPTVLAMDDGAVVCRKVKDHAPTIDGNLGPGEWDRNVCLQISKTESIKTAPPTTPAADASGTGGTPRQSERYMVPKLVLSHYFYWYQGDPRKEAPAGHVLEAGGRSGLTDHPLRGVGPWLSNDRVQWHKDELSDIRGSGIDVILPIYWGSSGDKRTFASKGLNCMVQGLRELKAEGKSYPLVGMFFDTTAMLSEYGSRPDLKDDEVKETFYGMIKDFYLQIPEEFRAVVQTPLEKGGYGGYPVVLYTANFLSDFDSSFVEYSNKRFAQDFGGRRIVWTGGGDFRAKAPALDGYVNYGAGLGLSYDDTGWIHIAAIGAGFDNGAVAGRNASIRPRMAGRTYEDDWGTLYSKSPDWVVVDGWNELHEGSDICSSMEYGDRYMSLTKFGIVKFNGLNPFDARYLRHDTPKVMLPGQTYQVTLTVKNVGAKPWYAREFVFLAARWYKDGRLFADSGARLPIQGNTLVGQIVQKTMGIRTVDQEGKPLPEGDYELRWDMTHGHDDWFSGGGSVPLRVPVRIGAPSPGYTLVDTTMPALMKSGATYTVKARIRNDGPVAWKSDKAKIRYAWYKVSTHLGKSSADAAEEQKAQVADVALPSDVEPGRVVEVTVPLQTSMADGSPMPVWTQNDLWTYAVQWRVFDGEKEMASQGIGSASEAVKVVADDLGPKFSANDAPAQMPAGRKYGVNLTLQNTGVETWTKADYSIGYHWYALDGSEVVWDGVKTPLLKDVAPGGLAMVKASTTAPAYDGQYYLVWDLARGDKWASTTANTRGGDISVSLVNVTNGGLVTVDLDKLYDFDVVSSDTNPKDGNADGSGATIPAECIPPFASTALTPSRLYPSGLWANTPTSPAESASRISFRYPLKIDGAKNSIICKGQTIGLRSGKYQTIHVLAISAQDTTGDFGLVYGSKKVSASTRFTGWGEAPKYGERIGYVALHRHTPTGNVKEPCYLDDYTLKADPATTLTALTLPANSAVKVIAITLEK